MKECKDCKHYRPEKGFDDPTGSFATCAAPKIRWPYVEHNRGDRFPIDILAKTCGRPARWFEPKPVAALTVEERLQAAQRLAHRLNPQVPPRRNPTAPSRALAAASVPRRAPVSAAAPSASRSSTTDDGMSMLPAAMLLSSHDVSVSEGRPDSCSRWDAPASGGGSFDGGGASGNWDSGSSSSSDSYSSSDSSSSSSSSD